jgi:nucleoid DNA-binding protein
MLAYMAWTPPTKHLKNKETLDSERFYRLLSEQSNFIDPDTSFLFYMGLVVLISDELRKNKIVRLPHLGDFALVEQRSRPAWMGKLHAVIGSREILKFYPKERLRRYFSKRQGLPRYSEVLPPAALR